MTDRFRPESAHRKRFAVSVLDSVDTAAVDRLRALDSCVAERIVSAQHGHLVTPVYQLARHLVGARPRRTFPSGEVLVYL